MTPDRARQIQRGDRVALAAAYRAYQDEKVPPDHRFPDELDVLQVRLDVLTRGGVIFRVRDLAGRDRWLDSDCFDDIEEAP